VDGDQIRTLKVLSRPDAPHEAIAEGIRRLGLDREPFEAVVGTTIATNALLERRGAELALVTTRGFEDLVEIGRQARGSLYDLSWERPEPLVPRGRRIGVAERVGPGGMRVTPLSLPQVRRAARRLKGAVDAVVVCFLHSYASPQHEEQAAAILRRAGLPTICSSEVLPEYREFERFSTALAAAYVEPVMSRYLEGLRRVMGNRATRVTSGTGGTLTAEGAARRPAETLLSGPVAGVCAAHALAAGRVISLDMGGTSTDVALIDGEPRRSRDLAIAGVPVRLPFVEIETIGAGGGSIIYVDAGGALRVGPRSAGAHPGPACYGRGGTEFTLTDAHLLLGRLPPSIGGIRLERARAEEAAAPFGPDAPRAAIEIANAAMERAVKVVSVERGYDPADFTLVAFGGMGPLHACDLVDRLGLKAALVPRHAGCFSALGAVLGDFTTERWRSASEANDAAFGRLEEELRERLRREGLDPAAAVVRRRVEMRYVGQSYELTLDWPASEDDFHAAHRLRYEHDRRGDPIETVTVGVRMTIPRARPPLRFASPPRAVGPAMLVLESATVWVAEGFEANPDESGNLLLVRRG
jgi:N-methylhydantoinase A